MDEETSTQMWDNVANSLKGIAKKVLGESKGKQKLDKETWWWNESIQEVHHHHHQSLFPTILGSAT